MRKAVGINKCLSLLLIYGLLASQLLGSSQPALAQQVLALPRILLWGIVDTPAPGLASNIIVPSEIDCLALGTDDNTFYAVDIPNRQVYKSTDAGVTWPNTYNLTGGLTTAGANLPAWNIAVAPDNVDFVVAITDGTGAPNGPKNVFISTDGGQNWQNTNLPPLPLNEYISCVAISPQYTSSNRYVAIATRNGAGGGRVFTIKSPGTNAWINQTLPPSLNWIPGDVVALKFSPSYVSDNSIVIVFASPSGFYLNIGTHDIIANRTTWRSGLGFPVKITSPSDNRSPTNAQIITADLELPSDFSGSDPGALRRYFLSYDARDAGTAYFSGIFRVDNTVAVPLMYSTSLIAAPDNRIASISYWGSYGNGKLIAGEVTTDATKGLADIWLCLNPFTTAPYPGWKLGNALKSPTGGGNSGRTNALVTWSTAGSNAYCGTGSADLSQPGTAWVAGQWPIGLWSGVFVLDESAFSVSLDGGNIWNQISLIDTEVTRLTDVAVMEVPEDSLEYGVLYLASINTNGAVVTNFDSIWRSTSNPLSQRWERILCTPTANTGILLRLNPRLETTVEKSTQTKQSAEVKRSKVIVYAERFRDKMCYSADEGQFWQILYPSCKINDFTLASDQAIYILEDFHVIKGTLKDATWTWSSRLFTGLTTLGHTITTPLKNPQATNTKVTNNEGNEDWVIVGSEMLGEVAWADFSKGAVKFEPPSDLRKRLPVEGDVHIVADEQFEVNHTIYAASRSVSGAKIYRWIIGKSKEWDRLEPPNSDFYGLEQRSGVLYGAFDITTLPRAGADRTLYPRTPVPPPLEWDDLTEGLTNDVRFTREPSGLKISTRTENSLWAIDDRNFNWAANPKTGCLWGYTDTLAKNGPWTTAPASGDSIPADPVTGRANEVNFAWRQLSYTLGYELQIAKDDTFTLGVLIDETIVPANPLSPARVLFPGLLEASHKYFWRVRSRSATTGEFIRSPWSATMYFTVMAGLPVQAKHLGPVLLQPPNNCTSCSPSPAFSWSPMFQATQYEFVLARNATLTQIVDTATVPTTAYQYNGKLDKETYYWQVKAVKPMISEASPIGCFTVASENVPASTIPLGISDPLELAIWIGIIIYTAFAIALFTLIMTRRYRREG